MRAITPHSLHYHKILTPVIERKGFPASPISTCRASLPFSLCQHHVLPRPCAPHSHINIVLTSNIITCLSLGCGDCLCALSRLLPRAIQQEILSTEIRKQRNTKEPCTRILFSIKASKGTSRPIPQSLCGCVSSLQRGQSWADRGSHARSTRGKPKDSPHLPVEVDMV